MDLRHLSRLDQQERDGPALREYGPVDYGDRRAGEHRDRIHGDAIRQHHGLCAGAVQHIHRSAVWDGDSGHALEANYRTGGLLGFAVWHGVIVKHVAVGENRSIRASIYCAVSLRESDGGGYVPRLVVL